MKFPALEEARNKLNALRKELVDVFAEAGPDRDMTLVNSLSGSTADKVDWIRAKNEEIIAAKDKYEELRTIDQAAGFAADHPEMGESVDDDPAPGRPVQSFGRQFVKSAAFRKNGPTATLDLDIRNTLFERTAGWSPETTRTGRVDLSPEPRLSVLDFVNTLPTNQSAIKFMRETTFTDTAVVEKAEGVAYGEAALALTEITQSVEKIPVFLPVADEQLEDEDGAAAYIDSRLIYMVRKRLNTQILSGTGIAPLLLGTENVSGIQVQALGADPVADAIYKLFVKIQDDSVAGGGDADPNVVFIRPTKWQSVRLLRTADGIYIWGNPSEAGPMRVWGVPVVTTNAVTATKAIAGDYREHAALYVKRGVDVQVSNSHSDYFASGKQAVRADIRVAMVHFRPSAFGEVTGL